MGLESNSGTADARAAVTWPSTEIAARLNPLPNCSFMCQSFYSRIFELGDCFVAQSSPGWAILSVVTEGRRVDATLLQIDLHSIFVPQYWPTLQTFSRCQLSKKYLLWNPTVWHAHNVTNPSKLRFKQESFYTHNTTGVQYICVGNYILPLDTSYLSQTAEMELVQSADWSPVKRPHLTPIQQCRQHHSSVDGNLCFQEYIMHAPQSSLKFTKSTACLSETGCDVAVCRDGVWQETARVAELVNGFQGDIIAGRDTGWRSLMWWYDTWLQSSSSWRSIQTVWRRCWTGKTRFVRLLACEQLMHSHLQIADPVEWPAALWSSHAQVLRQTRHHL